jgi:hypothetical protein
MKKLKLQASFLIGAVLFVISCGMASAQNSITTPDGTSPVPLSFGVSQVVRLSQAKITDATIINYVQNSGIAYSLTTDDIVYLKEQSVSDAVINAMLTQHNSPASVTTPTIADNTAVENEQVPITVIQPIIAYAQPAPFSSVIIIPDSQTARYDHWYYNHANGFRYGNGFDFPYSYSYRAVSVSVGYGSHLAGRSHVARHH